MKTNNFKLLPSEGRCNLCGLTKPVAEMQVVYYRREKIYYLRPRCKACHNERERGHRREWKRRYLQNWRKANAAVNESYWKGNPEIKEQNRIRGYQRFQAKHDAILIQGRLRRRGMNVSLKEAERLLQKFGRCYPLRAGLTPEGLRECERIRSRLRRGNKKLRLTSFDIRLMVYDDRLFIKPKTQKRLPRPYQKAAKRLRDWQKMQRENAQKDT